MANGQIFPETRTPSVPRPSSGLTLSNAKGESMPKPKYHIVVCTNSRPPGHPKPSCGAAGSPGVMMAFNIGVMQRAYQPGQVLVTSSSSLGTCKQSPTVFIYPAGNWSPHV